MIASGNDPSHRTIVVIRRPILTSSQLSLKLCSPGKRNVPQLNVRERDSSLDESARAGTTVSSTRPRRAMAARAVRTRPATMALMEP